MPDVVGTQQDSHDIWLPWHRGGCSIIPIRPDGRKAPWFEWRKYQQVRPTFSEAVVPVTENAPDSALRS